MRRPASCQASTLHVPSLSSTPTRMSPHADDAKQLPEMLGRSREPPSMGPTSMASADDDDPADLIALLHSCSPTYMQARRGGSGRPSAPSSFRSESPPTVLSASPSSIVAPAAPAAASAPPIAEEPTAFERLTTAVDAALAAASCPAKAAIFVEDERTSASVLDKTLLVAAQHTCAPEARVKLSGKRRQHVSVNAIDEAALERSLLVLMLHMCERADADDVSLHVEVRWLLRGPPLRRAPQLLQVHCS